MQDDLDPHADGNGPEPHDAQPVVDLTVMESIACLRAIIASQQRQISRIAQIVAMMSGDPEIARRVQEMRAEEDIRAAKDASDAVPKGAHLRVIK